VTIIGGAMPLLKTMRRLGNPAKTDESRQRCQPDGFEWICIPGPVAYTLRVNA
jgi:hypothetical protein